MDFPGFPEVTSVRLGAKPIACVSRPPQRGHFLGTVSRLAPCSAVSKVPWAWQRGQSSERNELCPQSAHSMQKTPSMKPSPLWAQRPSSLRSPTITSWARSR